MLWFQFYPTKMQLSQNNNYNPRFIVIQKLYGNHFNKEQKIVFPKHRYKKFIKDIVSGTIERKEFIDEIITSELQNEIRVLNDLLLKIIIEASIYEFAFRPDTPIKVIINEYLNVAKILLDEGKKSFLHAILDKLAKKMRWF